MLIFFEKFFFFFSSFLIFFCAVSIFNTPNAVKSALFLIATYIFVAFLLFLLHLDFLALLFIIVYIGAIVVLFLFVIMMIDLKNETSNSVFVLNNSFLSFLIFLFISEVFCFFLFIDFESWMYLFFWFSNYFDQFLEISNSWFFFNITLLPEVMAFIFFEDYTFTFLLIGILLVIAMIGSISITIKHKNNINYQEFFYQYDKDYSHTILI